MQFLQQLKPLNAATTAPALRLGLMISSRKPQPAV
jgi:hypothetical protein